MRIAFVSYDFGEYSINHATAMADEHEVLLLLADDLGRSHEYKLASSVDYQPFDKPRLRHPLRQISSVRCLLRKIDEFAPDVVHFQRGHLWFNWALPRLARRYPLVVTVHDPTHHLGDSGSKKTPQRLMEYGYRSADRIIVHGEALRGACAEFGLPPAKIDVVPHIAIGDRPSAPVEERDGQVLFFGRIWEYKGLDYLVKAAPLIRSRVPHSKIVIAGEGDYRGYRSLIEEPHQFVILDRWISDDERSELFMQSSVVVLPYVEATQSGVVPIAYTYAKPIVATRTGALPEVVHDGVSGILVEPRNEAALADAITTLLGDRSLRKKMGDSGRCLLDTVHAPRRVADQTVDVYRRAIADARGRLSPRAAVNAVAQKQ
ncbi:MAG: glycosyltransferase family 4 protein [Myxococcales bacterium]|nr:glycosyltransferase family 4 protein [Myxococcales bacterium]